MPLIIVLIVAAVLYKFAWFFAAIALSAAAAWAISRAVTHHDAIAAVRRARDAELRARADRQHAAILAGDEQLGLHGDYPPDTW